VSANWRCSYGHDPRRLQAYQRVPCVITVEVGALGVIATLTRPSTSAPFAKFLITGGGNVLQRAIHAVYCRQAGDADAYFEAAGMSDERAFAAGEDSPWRRK